MTEPVYNLTVTPGDLGYKWRLAIEGKNVGGGVQQTLWQSLDASNDRLHELFFEPLGAYYQSQLGTHGRTD